MAIKEVFHPPHRRLDLGLVREMLGKFSVAHVLGLQHSTQQQQEEVKLVLATVREGVQEVEKEGVQSGGRGALSYQESGPELRSWKVLGTEDIKD